MWLHQNVYSGQHFMQHINAKRNLCTLIQFHQHRVWVAAQVILLKSKINFIVLLSQLNMFTRFLYCFGDLCLPDIWYQREKHSCNDILQNGVNVYYVFSDIEHEIVTIRNAIWYVVNLWIKYHWTKDIYEIGHLLSRHFCVKTSIGFEEHLN